MKLESQVTTKQKPSWMTENLKFLLNPLRISQMKIFLNEYNLKVTEMWGESRFLILNNLFAVIHVDSNYSFGRKSQWC